MPIQSIVQLYDGSDPPVEIGIRLNGVGKDGFMEILYADIPGNSWNQNRLDKFTLRAQDLIDVRIPLTDPQFMEEGVIVDPAALVDPALPHFFWDKGDLVSRAVIISDVTFTDRLNFTLTRAR
jgi:hypothetical protein